MAAIQRLCTDTDENFNNHVLLCMATERWDELPAALDYRTLSEYELNLLIRAGGFPVLHDNGDLIETEVEAMKQLAETPGLTDDEKVDLISNRIFRVREQLLRPDPLKMRR